MQYKVEAEIQDDDRQTGNGYKSISKIPEAFARALRQIETKLRRLTLCFLGSGTQR